MLKKVVTLALAGIMAFSMAACGSSGSSEKSASASSASSAVSAAVDAASSSGGAKSADGKYKIAFLGSMNTDESIKYFGECAQKEAEALGNATVTIFDGNADPQKQSNQIADCISDGYDAMLIIGVDPVAIVPAVKKASEAGVAVVMLACDIDDSGKDYRIASVTCEHYNSGVLAAEHLIKAFPDGAKGIMIEGHPGEDTTVKRSAGFEDTIKGTNIELLDKRGCESWDSSKALAATQDFISKYGDEIQFVYAHCDLYDLPICQALEDKGMLENTYIISIDGNRVGFDLIKEGKVQATMFQDINEQSKEAVDVAVKYLETGEVDEEVVDTGWTEITKDNCDFDPGW